MCILKIHSDTMSFEAFSRSTSLPIVSCQIKGQLRPGRSGKISESHRISIEVSEKDWDDFKGQVTDAIAFLREHEEELTDLAQHPETTDAFLDFPLYSRLSDEVINQNDQLPRELLRLAGRIGLGINMAIYDKQAFDELGIK